MLTYNDILSSVTKILDEKFNIDVLVDEGTNLGDECFFVQILPTLTDSANYKINRKSLIISIKYLSNDANTFKLNSMSDDLSNVFSRVIKVKDRVLTVSNIEPNILKDEVGYMLDFLITTTYFDEKVKDELEENYDFIQEININFTK